MVGKIISIVLAGLVMLCGLFYFAKKRSVVLMALTAVIWLGFIGMMVLTWYVSPDFLYGVIVMAVVCAISSLSAIIVYQSDLRAFFMRLSKFHKKNMDYNVTDEEMREAVSSIVMACQTMAKSRTGALILVMNNDEIDHYILDSGIKLNALISAPLLESIFNTSCPMHDGAVVIRGTRIVAAGCFLPLSKNEQIAKDLGTRHRAGIGVSETCDVTSIIISEENGIISSASGGKLKRYLTPERLFDLLYDPYKTTMPISVKKSGSRKSRKEKQF